MKKNLKIVFVFVFLYASTTTAQVIQDKITTSNGEYSIRTTFQTDDISIIENVSGEIVAKITPPTPCHSASLSSDDSKLFVPTGDKVYVYEFESQELLNTYDLKSYFIDDAYKKNISDERYGLHYNRLIASGDAEKNAVKSATSQAKKDMAAIAANMSFTATVYNPSYSKLSFFHFNNDGTRLIRFHMYTSIPYASGNGNIFEVRNTCVMDCYDTKDFSLIKHEICQNQTFGGNEVGYTPFRAMVSNELFIFGNEEVKYYDISKNEITTLMLRSEFESLTMGEERYNSLYTKVLAKHKSGKIAKKTLVPNTFGVGSGMISKYVLNDGMYLGDFSNFFGSAILTDIVNNQVVYEFENGVAAMSSPDKKYIYLMRFNDELLQMSSSDSEFATAINDANYVDIELYDYSTKKLITTFKSCPEFPDTNFKNGKLILDRSMNNKSTIIYDLATGKIENL